MGMGMMGVDRWDQAPVDSFEIILSKFLDGDGIDSVARQRRTSLRRCSRFILECGPAGGQGVRRGREEEKDESSV